MRKKNAFINVTASMGRGLLYAYLYIMFRPKICYQSRKAKEEIEKGGVIFIGNHVGHNDGQMFYMLFKNSVLIIAKDWADKKILKWLTSGGKFISVDRFGTDITWIRGASEHLRAGDNMIIFPEGHTSKTGVMDEFKPGFAMLAVMSGAKIVPVYNDGEYHKLFLSLLPAPGSERRVPPDRLGLPGCWEETTPDCPNNFLLPDLTHHG